MNEHDIAEQAYKNGYEDGKRDAVKHGRWIEKPYLLGNTRYCSICGQNYGMPHGVLKYCPNCGAVMEDKHYAID